MMAQGSSATAVPESPVSVALNSLHRGHKILSERLDVLEARLTVALRPLSAPTNRGQGEKRQITETGSALVEQLRQMDSIVEVFSDRVLSLIERIDL